MSEPDGRELLSHLYTVFHGDQLSLCGCGDPSAAITLVHQLLSLAPLYRPWSRSQVEALIGSDGAQNLVLNTLTNAGLLEHGGSIHGSWLTDRGRWLLWAVDQLGGLKGLSERLDDAGFPQHGDAGYPCTPCTDACWAVPDGWQPPVLTGPGDVT